MKDEALNVWTKNWVVQNHVSRNDDEMRTY